MLDLFQFDDFPIRIKLFDRFNQSALDLVLQLPILQLFLRVLGNLACNDECFGMPQVAHRQLRPIVPAPLRFLDLPEHYREVTDAYLRLFYNFHDQRLCKPIAYAFLFELEAVDQLNKLWWELLHDLYQHFLPPDGLAFDHHLPDPLPLPSDDRQLTAHEYVVLHQLIINFILQCFEGEHIVSCDEARDE